MDFNALTQDEFLIANATLAAEEFEGETVLLDVVRGLYFSLSGAAIELWRAFGEPRRAAEVVDTLCASLTGADRAALLQAVQNMFENQLLLEAEDSSRIDSKPLIVNAAAFVSPAVERFDDLADLIIIDPVHEVNARAGWPVRQDEYPNAG